MASVLEQLDRDSFLLLYVSGELSAEDATEVERRVASDPALAVELERLRETQSFVNRALAGQDEQTRLPMNTDTAVRRVSRAMKQWQVERLTKKSMQPITGPRFRLPIWSYPVAVAAAVIVAMMIWARSLPDASENRLTAAQIAELQQKTTQEFQSDFEDSYYQELESQDLLATRELPAAPEDFVNDVFLRSGG